MAGWFRIKAFLLLGTVLIAIAIGCGLVKDDFAATSDCSLATGATSADAESKFSSDVFPLLGTNCRQCHNGPNPIGPNRVGDVDIEISRTEATTRLLSGALASRGTDGHCQGCAVANDPGAKANFKTQLEQWLQLVQGASGFCPSTTEAVDLFTANFAVPATVNDTTPVYVRVSLDPLGHPGVFIDVGVKIFADGYYEFSDFRVYTGTYQLDLGGLKIWTTDGTEREGNNTLATFKFTVPRRTGVNSGASPVLVPPITTQSVIAKRFGATDQFQLSFQKTAAIKDCKAFPTFRSNMLSAVNNGINGSGACIACHGIPTDTAFTKFPISLADEKTLCLAFRWRLAPGLNDGSSLLLKKLLGAEPPHPITFLPDDLELIRAWRTLEFQ